MRVGSMIRRERNTEGYQDRGPCYVASWSASGLALRAVQPARRQRCHDAPPFLECHTRHRPPTLPSAGGRDPSGRLVARLAQRRVPARPADATATSCSTGRANLLWNTGTRGDAPDHLVMQNDGNLVLYQGLDVFGAPRAAAGLAAAAYYLNLQNDGNAVIYSPAGKPIWTTNTDIQPGLQFGDAGSSVLRLQQVLNGLGYWVGPANGVFGDSTQQAVWALQKAAGLSRDGVVGTRTVVALASGVVPTPDQHPAT